MFRLSLSGFLLLGAFFVLLSVSAAPPKTEIHFTPPLAAAKTFQVTEVVYEDQGGSAPGSLKQAGIMKIWMERPNKFRVEWRSRGNPTVLASVDISDGQTAVSYVGKESRTQATDRAEWPFPLMGLLNGMSSPTSAVPAVRNGRKILLSVRSLPTGRQEIWFDPKTHLPLHDALFITWQGKTAEVMRTEYSGWTLNKTFSPAVFRLTEPAKAKKK